MAEKCWRRVSLIKRMTVEGGYATSARTAVSNEWPCDGKLASFVKVNKTSLWLLQLCYGRGAQKGYLRATMAIETIWSLCRNIIDTNRTDDTTETSAVVDVNYPMHVLERIAADPTPQREKGRKRQRGVCTGVMQRVSMPELFNATQLRRVRVVLTPKNSLDARGRRTVVGRIYGVGASSTWWETNNRTTSCN